MEIKINLTVYQAILFTIFAQLALQVIGEVIFTFAYVNNGNAANSAGLNTAVKCVVVAGELQRSWFSDGVEAKQPQSTVQLASGHGTGRQPPLSDRRRRRMSTSPRRRAPAAACHSVPRQPRSAVRRWRSGQRHVAGRRRRRPAGTGRVAAETGSGASRPAVVGRRSRSTGVDSPSERPRSGAVCAAAGWPGHGGQWPSAGFVAAERPPALPRPESGARRAEGRADAFPLERIRPFEEIASYFRVAHFPSKINRLGEFLHVWRRRSYRPTYRNLSKIANESYFCVSEELVQAERNVWSCTHVVFNLISLSSFICFVTYDNKTAEHSHTVNLKPD